MDHLHEQRGVASMAIEKGSGMNKMGNESMSDLGLVANDRDACGSVSGKGYG